MFPECSLNAEVKLVCDAPPVWVSELVESDLLIEKPKFSKFMHGTAFLRRAKIAASKKVMTYFH
jgi:SPX domain protein involved in polyphosphate accumulation